MSYGCLATIGPAVNLTLHEAQHQYGWGKKFSLLDVGCGFGVMGAVARCFYPQLKVYGVDAVPTFRRLPGRPETAPSIWDAIYEDVVIADIRSYLPQLVEEGRKYTVGYFFEVLEHLVKDDGHRIMDLLPQVAEHWLMSTPDSFFATAHGPHQDHVSVWTKEELRDHGWQILQPKPEPTSWRALGYPMYLAYKGSWDLGERSGTSPGLWIDETPSDEGLVLDVPAEIVALATP